MTDESFYLYDSRAWESFVKQATPIDLTDLSDALPDNDVGNYRRVCITIILGDYQSGLDILEEGGALFEERLGAGLHTLVRQRLGLPLRFFKPDDWMGQEDYVYWYLAWGLETATTDQLEAKHFLLKAKNLASDLGMQMTLETIETALENLYKPHLGLPLVAPPHSVLVSPQAFDKLRQNKDHFERLSDLGNMQLSTLQGCRYAQYLLYNQKYKEALQVIEKVSPEKFPLAHAIKMKILEVLEQYDLLSEMIESFKPGSSEPLEAEATILSYESCAYYFAVVNRNYALAYAYLYRAEALAIEHKLTYRLGVIRMHLEVTANMVGDNLTLDPLYETETGDFKLKSIRNRFDSFLRAGNIQAIEAYVEKGSLSQEELLLAQATLEYSRFTLGQGSISVTSKLLSDDEPEHPTSKLYWALLMLQIFSNMGEASGRANPERICKTLDSALVKIEQVNSVLPVAANVYPLGLAIASKIHNRLANADQKVALLWSEHSRDGLRRDGKKLTTITKPIREALLLDEVYGTREHYASVTHYQTGHAENKARLERSLEQVGLKRWEIATIGGVYRGLLRLGQVLGDRAILETSEHVLQSSSFLRENLVRNALNF